jgi:predicted ATPase
VSGGRGGGGVHLRRVRIRSDLFPTRDCYPFSLEVLQRTEALSFPTAVTFLVGENGCGKSTLLEAITRACGIHIWHGDQRTRYRYNPHEGELHRFVEREWANGGATGAYFAAQTFQGFSRILDEWASSDPGVLEYFGGRSLLTQSHGQSLMSFFRSRFALKGLYLLDEPETALSPRTQLELRGLLGDCIEEGRAQFIIATHSPILLSCSGATIYSFDHVPIRCVAYEETEHYRVYRDFMQGKDDHDPRDRRPREAEARPET